MAMLTLLPVAMATVRSFHVTLDEALFDPPPGIGADGDDNRVPRLLMDGSFPGPTFSGNLGDTLLITVTSHLSEHLSSIHWHGLAQTGNPWNDGVSGVTDCGLPPGMTKTYNVTLDMPGTRWWHGHTGSGHTAGLLGPLIVYSPDAESEQQKYGYVEEFTLVLTDFFTMPTQTQSAGMSVQHASSVWPGATNGPQALLVNGRGARDCSEELTLSGDALGTLCDPSGDALYRMHVTAGATYRLRLIGAATLTVQYFEVEGHSLTIIAADGTPVEPRTVSAVIVSPGQRYDVLLRADQPPDVYWVLQRSRYRDGPAFLGQQSGQAILAYEDTSGPRAGLPSGARLQVMVDANVQPSGPKTDANSLFNDEDIAAYTAYANDDFAFNSLVPTLESPPCPPTATRTLNWQFANEYADLQTGRSYTPFDTEAGFLLMPPAPPQVHEVWAMDGKLLFLGGEPYLQTAYEGGEAAALQKAAGPPISHVIPLHSGDVVDILLSNGPMPNIHNGAQNPHSMHLHGHDFYVIGAGVGAYDASTAKLNTTRPLFRDTVLIPPLSWVMIRFVADNPGAWLMHCHLDFHLAIRQGAIFVERADEIPPPPADLLTCAPLDSRSAPSDDGVAPAPPPPFIALPMGAFVGLVVAVSVLCLLAGLLTLLLVVSRAAPEKGAPPSNPDVKFESVATVATEAGVEGSTTTTPQAEVEAGGAPATEETEVAAPAMAAPAAAPPAAAQGVDPADKV